MLEIGSGVASGAGASDVGASATAVAVCESIRLVV